MRKFITLLLACVLAFSLCAVPTFAADTLTLTLGDVTVDVNADNTISVPVSFSATAEAGATAISSIQFVLNVPDGVTFTGAAKAADNSYAWTNNTTTANTQFWFDDPSGAGIDLFANPEYAKFVLTFTVDTSVANTYEIGVDESTIACCDWMDFKDWIDYAGAATVETSTITVKAEEPAPSVNIVATSNREAVTEKATHQIGTAVGMTVTVPDGVAFQKMIWVIANGSERLYAKEIVDLTDIPVAGDIKVAATFVNGSHDDVYEGAKVVAPLTIGVDDFDAIFTDGTNDYFTNAADKAE